MVINMHSEPLPTDKVELFTKIISEAYQDFLNVFSQEEAKNMPPHCDLTMKFTLRVTRHLLIATYTCSLPQSLVSYANSSMICSERGSSDHPSHQQVHLFSLPRRRMVQLCVNS